MWVGVIVVALPSTDAPVHCLRNVFSMHELPGTVVSDNGPAFLRDE